MTLQYIPCAQNDNKGEQITRNFLMSSLAYADGVLLLTESNQERRKKSK
jgi:hypothetical protein